MAGPIIIRRDALAEGLLDTIVELAYETIQRRAMHRRAGRLMPDLANEDQVRRFLAEHRRQRGLKDYELSERQGQ